MKSLKFIKKLQQWYKGEFVPPPRNDPYSSLIIISPGYYKQPLLAKIIKKFINVFCNYKNFIVKAIIGCIITIIISKII